jgi:hypothetical protein
MPLDQRTDLRDRLRPIRSRPRAGSQPGRGLTVPDGWAASVDASKP